MYNPLWSSASFFGNDLWFSTLISKFLGNELLDRITGKPIYQKIMSTVLLENLFNRQLEVSFPVKRSGSWPGNIKIRKNFWMSFPWFDTKGQQNFWPRYPLEHIKDGHFWSKLILNYDFFGRLDQKYPEKMMVVVFIWMTLFWISLFVLG